MVDDPGLDAGFDSGDATTVSATGNELASLFDGLQSRASGLTAIADAFASAMTRAFSQSASSGKQFDNVLKSLATRISSMALSQALRPLFSGLSGGTGGNLFGGLSGAGGGGGGGGIDSIGNVFNPDISMLAAFGGIKPFAAGGVIGTPTYFPLGTGGLGLAGESGPEAIMPLARGADGRLGVAASGRAAFGNIVVQITTPDADSFRRSEVYVTGQIARAVARGQRGL
jgi:lambda family phage tail tape measure protein